MGYRTSEKSHMCGEQNHVILQNDWQSVTHIQNKFNLFFIFLPFVVSHIGTLGKKKNAVFIIQKTEAKKREICIISHLSPCSRSQTKCAACIIISQPHCLLARFALGDIIWHLIACVHIPASNMCLLYIFDSNSLLLVYKNQMIWNEKVFRLNAPVRAQRSDVVKRDGICGVRKSTYLITEVVWHNCCWQGAGQDRGGKCTVLCVSKKSECSSSKMTIQSLEFLMSC